MTTEDGQDRTDHGPTDGSRRNLLRISAMRPFVRESCPTRGEASEIRTAATRHPPRRLEAESVCGGLRAGHEFCTLLGDPDRSRSADARAGGHGSFDRQHLSHLGHEVR